MAGEDTARAVHMPGASLASFHLMIICLQIKEQSLSEVKSVLLFIMTLEHIFVVYIW